MLTKGNKWKLVRKGKNQIHWVNLHPVKFGHQYPTNVLLNKNHYTGIWRFSTIWGNKSLDADYRTKTKALQEAKDYMARKPKG